MAFPLFEQVQHSVRNTGFLGELSVRHFTPRFPQVFSQLSIQTFSHREMLTKKTSSMVYDMLDSTI